MEKLFRIVGVSVLSVLIVSSIVYASSTIISVQTQSIAQGDVIANGWFQEVNDRLKNIFSSGGNVGIGTNNPEQLLTIRGQYPYIRFEDTEDPNGSAGTITSHQDARMYYDANFNNSANPTGGEHVFRADGGTKILMTLKNSGNIGIGTTTPSVKLDVNGDIQSNNIKKIIWSQNTSGTYNLISIFDNARTTGLQPGLYDCTLKTSNGAHWTGYRITMAVNFYIGWSSYPHVIKEAKDITASLSGCSGGVSGLDIASGIFNFNIGNCFQTVTLTCNRLD